MKRKLTIAAGIIHQPAILFLDEPTTGIDVASARQIRKMIADLNGSGTTIFLTTHYIEEAERLCRRIAFLVDGRIVRVGKTKELLHEFTERHVVQFLVPHGGRRVCRAPSMQFPASECRMVDTTSLRVTAAEAFAVGPIVSVIEEHGGEVLEARRSQPTLEEIFVHVTGIESAAMSQERSGGATEEEA